MCRGSMNATTLDEARLESLHLAELLRREHVALADFLVALAEFDRTEGFRTLGYATLFHYLLNGLRISRGAAHYRKVAARLIGRFPEVAEPLRDGRLCLSSIIPLARVITAANREQVIPRFFHCSSEEAKAVAAEIAPAMVVPRRTVVTTPAQPAWIATPVNSGTSSVHTDELVGMGELRVCRVEMPRAVVEPLTATQSRIHLTVSRGLLGKLRKARDGQSHVQPGATEEQVIEAALDLLLAQQERRRAAVPPKVKREVMKRDGARCTWPLAGGGTCGSTVRLQVDHVVPRAMGGASTVENCRILCQAHNLEAAREAYGDELMDLFAPADRLAREPVATYEAGGGVTSGPGIDGGATTGGAKAIGSGCSGLAIQSATYRMIPHPPAKMDRMKRTRTSASGSENRSASPRHTPAIIFPSRARYHSRWSGRWSIQLVQWRQRTAPVSFSVRQ
jgi:5-methylcytosine-specific restriction endonuclease McrA